MKPDVDVFLRDLARSLVQEIVPQVQLEYAQGALQRAAMLTQVAAEEFDRAAARRIEENAALCRLFGDAGPVVADADLRMRLANASASPEDDLCVSALDARNHTLRALLIALHAHVEALRGEPARRIERAIWRELALSTGRRRVSIGRF